MILEIILEKWKRFTQVFLIPNYLEFEFWIGIKWKNCLMKLGSIKINL